LVPPQHQRCRKGSVLEPLHGCNAFIPIVEIPDKVHGIGESSSFFGEGKSNPTSSPRFEIPFLETHNGSPTLTYPIAISNDVPDDCLGYVHVSFSKGGRFNTDGLSPVGENFPFMLVEALSQRVHGPASLEVFWN
jgi:hypothetical protein